MHHTLAQHAVFTTLAQKNTGLGDVSRSCERETADSARDNTAASVASAEDVAEDAPRLLALMGEQLRRQDAQLCASLQLLRARRTYVKW